MTSTLPPLVQAFSGAFGSATANAIVYPLDLVTTRLQTTSSRKLRGLQGILLVLKHILKTEGWNGLYDGLGTDTAANLLSNFLYFYFYSFLRTLLLRRRAPPHRVHGKVSPGLLSVPQELGIGFVAGVASRAISTPLSVITVRLQTETEGEDEEGEMNAQTGGPEEADRRRMPRGVLSTMQRIYEAQGLSGFWGGFSTTILLSLNPAITLFLFQLFRRLTTRRQDAALGTPKASSTFLGAAFSNATVTGLLYPLMLAKTRLQVHRKSVQENGGLDHRKRSSANMVTVWEKAVRQEGLRGLYQGLDAQIAKAFVSQGVTMLVKQRIEAYVVALYVRSLKRRRP